ncbi:MAG: HAD family phosphatase [Parachlamydiales bacterium]|nr:HAD family phosphatase [Parachlamydiales bacterium]
MKKISFLLLLFLSLFNGNTVESNYQHPVFIFDFNGVLYKKDTKEISQFIAESMDIDPAETKAILKHYKHLVDAKKNEKPFWTRIANMYNKQIDAAWLEKLTQLNHRSYIPIAGMQEIIASLQKQGYHLAILSNTKANNAHLIRNLEYDKPFFPVLFAYEIGVKKPNLKAYRILLNRLKVPAQQCIFIDDQWKNIWAAQSLHFDSIHFHSPEQLIKELQKRGIHLSGRSKKISYLF